MSLAHLRAPRLPRPRKAAETVALTRVIAWPTAFCGASREPIYRTVTEASESGLELCDACLADSRRQRNPKQ